MPRSPISVVLYRSISCLTDVRHRKWLKSRYIFNRYIFDVPETDLWPLKLDSHDDFTFVSAGDTPANYSGPPYQPLAEFDDFARTFGRRREHHHARNEVSPENVVKPKVDPEWLRGWN